MKSHGPPWPTTAWTQVLGTGYWPTIAQYWVLGLPQHGLRYWVLGLLAHHSTVLGTGPTTVWTQVLGTGYWPTIAQYWVLGLPQHGLRYWVLGLLAHHSTVLGTVLPQHGLRYCVLGLAAWSPVLGCAVEPVLSCLTSPCSPPPVHLSPVFPEEATSERQMLFASEEDQSGTFSLRQEEYLDLVCPPEQPSEDSSLAAHAAEGRSSGHPSLSQIKTMPFPHQVRRAARTLASSRMTPEIHCLYDLRSTVSPSGL